MALLQLKEEMWNFSCQVKSSDNLYSGYRAEDSFPYDNFLQNSDGFLLEQMELPQTRKFLGVLRGSNSSRPTYIHC